MIDVRHIQLHNDKSGFIRETIDIITGIGNVTTRRAAWSLLHSVHINAWFNTTYKSHKTYATEIKDEQDLYRIHNKLGLWTTAVFHTTFCHIFSRPYK